MSASRLFLSLLSITLIGVAIVAALGGLATYEYLRPGPLTEEKLVLVERGTGVSGIAAQLGREGVISQPIVFKIAARLGGNGGLLKAGEYAFPAHVPMKTALQMMVDGDVYDRKVTVPEGLTSYQVVQLINKVDDLEGNVTTIPPEGSLLPETYHFVTGDTKQGKIDEMRAAMTKTIDELWDDRAKDLPINTKEEAIVLASIIEKETGVPEERRRVAGVFVNRLKRGIALQTDPTVIYAITKGKMDDKGMGPLGRRLLSKDLKVESPYNTYIHTGLPPGPIANPGRASIESALNPEQHDYIYFVADGSGGHIFATTLKEHNDNVANWRKIRRQKKN